jgi:predicted small lipoprotein YifL
MVIAPPKRLILTLLLAGVGLSACGYKAPVYYPTPEQRKELQEKQARIEARKQAAQHQQEESEKQAKEQAVTKQSPSS